MKHRIPVVIISIGLVVMLAALSVAGLSSSSAATGLLPVPTPKSVLGYDIGDEGHLTYYADVVNYFELVDKASNRVEVVEIGESTMGRPMYMAIVTAPENHAKLDYYKSIIQTLADPRETTEEEAEYLASIGKPVIFMEYNIHPQEVSTGETQMATLYKLAAGKDARVKEILDNTIVLIEASQSPDGKDMVCDWYYNYKGTEWEGVGPSSPPNYQRYLGHDTNRDFANWQIAESISFRDTWNEWLPTVHFSHHQMGSTGYRENYVPHGTWPLGYETHPTILSEWIMLGGHVFSDLATAGKTGYACTGYAGAIYHPMGSVGYTIGHHSSGTFMETAGTWGATSVYVDPEDLRSSAKEVQWYHWAPWPGGWWSMKDASTYEQISDFAVLSCVAKYHEQFLIDFAMRARADYEKGLTEPPYAFVIPAEQKDPATAAKMLNRFISEVVEVHVANEAFVADGTIYPAGSHVVLMAQPFGHWAKYLLEAQGAAPLERPYDVTAWTRGYSMGVDVIQVENAFDTDLSLVGEVIPPAGWVEGEAGYAYVFGHEMNNASVAVNRLLGEGYDVYWAAEPFADWPEGTVLVLAKSGLYDYITDLAEDLYLEVYSLDESIEIDAYELEMPRIALYLPVVGGSSNRDEGITRICLELHEFPYITSPDWEYVSHEMNNPDHPWAFSLSAVDVKAGALTEDDIDVLIMCDGSARSLYNGPSNSPLEGGLGADGTAILEDWIEDGGTLIGINRGGGVYPLDYFAADLGVEEADVGELWCPGTIVRAMVDNTHPIGYGMKDEAAAFFYKGPAYEVTTAQTVASYSDENLLMSGMIWNEEELYNEGAVVDATLGDGRVILIGFSVIQRNLMDGTYLLLFNSIHYAGAELTTLP